jgi:predicted Zn-dependent protease with MMP-like domain
VLLVVTRKPAVARWARQTIELGHPGFRLTPLVISFADVPRITDRDAASRLPQLAVLSVMAHPELEIAEVALEAISQLPEDLLRLYTDVILKALPAELRRILEARMIKGYQYQSDFARKYYGQGLEEGRQEGRERLQAAVVALARTKLKKVSDDDLARIAAITDLRVLTELVTSLGKTHSVARARAALDRALNH